jgi:hypothetical protein
MRVGNGDPLEMSFNAEDRSLTMRRYDAMLDIAGALKILKLLTQEGDHLKCHAGVLGKISEIEAMLKAEQGDGNQ